MCQVLLLWSCLRKVFFEKLNEVYGGLGDAFSMLRTTSMISL